MARTSLVFSIAFTGFIMLSIARGTVVVGAKVESGLVNANRHGVENVDLRKGQVNSDGQTGVNAAGGLADVNRNGHTTVDSKNGQVNKGGKNNVKAANGLVNQGTGGP
ncbi:hypothetical protein MKW92_051624 [Papaver armeniacum]|nr:hypothetical protein MKW92_051624 [Papaver armeniacum]